MLMSSKANQLFLALNTTFYSSLLRLSDFELQAS